MSRRAAASLLVAWTSGGDDGNGDGGARRVRIDAPAGASNAAVVRIEEEAARGAEAAAAWLGLALPAELAVAVRWFENHEAMGRALGWADLLLDDPRRDAVMITFGSGRDRQDGIALVDDARPLALAAEAGACAALRELVPEATAPMRVALAELVAVPGCAAECTALAAALRAHGLLPTLDHLRGPEPANSPLVIRVSAISLLAAQPVATRREALLAAATAEAAWSSALEGAARLESHAPPAVPTALRGFCFAHEGYRWFDGYGSRASWRSLARAKEIGSNAVSLTPFAFQRDAKSPTLGAYVEGDRGGWAAESDASLEVTAADARALGLTVVLKPHVWCGHRRWCGEIEMDGAEAWAAWFAQYERVAVHYALLARRCSIPVLCLGTELQGTTRHEKEWRALIAKVRALHPGVLTYCANWGEEVERLRFWDALDVVGVSEYWPLADAPGADAAEVERRFGDVLARMRKVGERAKRPVWFLEIGFADVKEPWLKPSEKAGPFDGGVDQALAYRLVLTATRRERFPEGLFWWKWPSDPWRLGPPDRSRDFWPCDRPAEREVEAAWRGAAK